MVGCIPTTLEERRRVEASLLGRLLLHPDMGASVRNVLRLDDFSEERHRLIYEALTTLLETPELFTIDAVSTLLTKDELEGVGGKCYLTFLQQQAESTTMPIEDQVQFLKLTTLYSLLDQIGGALHAHVGQEGEDDTMQIVSDLERARHITADLFTPKRHLSSHANSFQADLDTYLGELDTRRRARTMLTGISTGFVDLDMMTGGLQRSDLVIVAGPTSIGKTSFALGIALHVLLNEQHSVGLFSLEAPVRQVIGRLLSMEAHLDQHLLRSLALGDDEWRRLGTASAALSTANLWIDDTAYLSTAELRDKAHRLVERGGIQLLIVDYIHLMLASINDRRHANRVQEIGEISRSLKALARELDIPVLALAQVSRAFESRPSKKLQLSDLRDGSLENDADLVLFLSVSEAETAETVGSPTISIAKHRTGARADLDVCFLPGVARFHDFHTLSQTALREQSSSTLPTASHPQVKRHPRLQDIMARAMKRSAMKGNTEPRKPVKLGEPGRALPIAHGMRNEM